MHSRRKLTQLALNQPRPGNASICKTCRHWLQAFWNIGHANPCSKVGWDGPKRLKPGLVVYVNGVTVCPEHSDEACRKLPAQKRQRRAAKTTTVEMGI
jgi:hypothetical protein